MAPKVENYKEKALNSATQRYAMRKLTINTINTIKSRFGEEKESRRMERCYLSLHYRYATEDQDFSLISTSRY
jgi:hypothetical protein